MRQEFKQHWIALRVPEGAVQHLGQKEGDAAFGHIEGDAAEGIQGGGVLEALQLTATLVIGLDGQDGQGLEKRPFQTGLLAFPQPYHVTHAPEFFGIQVYDVGTVAVRQTMQNNGVARGKHG